MAPVVWRHGAAAGNCLCALRLLNWLLRPAGNGGPLRKKKLQTRAGLNDTYAVRPVDNIAYPDSSMHSCFMQSRDQIISLGARHGQKQAS